mmetsp:Transcript_12242/g.18775  ORF Transcript_12242/g.18775 Transcript_12242/m.18775 type:complete len:435 (-) Transcript_12242:217-1521(-)
MDWNKYLVLSLTFAFEVIFVWLEKFVDWFVTAINMVKEGNGTSQTSSKKSVVIVGGSFSGLAALHELESYGQFEVILIDQREYFEYTPGVLRLFCDPRLFEKMARSLKPPTNGRVLHGKVIDIKNNKISYVSAGGESTHTIGFDYVITATGSTYAHPITASLEESTLGDRQKSWINAHKELQSSKRIIVLGGGAVGVELAAEIVDYFPEKRVTIVDANSTLVPLFSKTTQDYAHNWLSQRSVDLCLGRAIKTWDEKSCEFIDGTILHADLVYLCFGGKANSSYMSSDKHDRQKRIVVNEELQVKGTNIFACGDVSSPPTEGRSQAFHAEVQGIVAARNVIRRETTGAKDMLKYPADICGSQLMPLVYVLSLGRYDGVLCFNQLILTGPLSAVFKWILEYTKVLHMEGKMLGKLIWNFGDSAVLFLSRNLIYPPK